MNEKHGCLHKNTINFEQSQIHTNEKNFFFSSNLSSASTFCTQLADAPHQLNRNDWLFLFNFERL